VTHQADPCFPARFDPDAWSADLERSTTAGRAAAQAARREYEHNGVPRSHLRPCEAEGRKTNLPDCAKVYVPTPNGRWGFVFQVAIADGRPRMDFIAFGVRHHPKGAHALDVYDVAATRLARARTKYEPPG
jgi:hypothetical protein